MAIPPDMKHVPTIIEKKYVRLIDLIALRDRHSRSRVIRDLVVESLKTHFPRFNFSEPEIDDALSEIAALSERAA